MQQKQVIFFVTTTGDTNVIDSRHFELLKDGAILANAGHFNVEIAMEELRKNKGNQKRSKRKRY